MTAETLYDRTLEASAEVSRLKHPDIDDWIKEIDLVLSAAGECLIGSDKVEMILIYDNHVSIETSYSVRCCAQSNEMSIPTSVLTADDPIKAANKFRLDRELNSIPLEKQSAQKKLEYCSKKEESLREELASLAS